MSTSTIAKAPMNMAMGPTLLVIMVMPAEALLFKMLPSRILLHRARITRRYPVGCLPKCAWTGLR